MRIDAEEINKSIHKTTIDVEPDKSVAKLVSNWQDLLKHFGIKVERVTSNIEYLFICPKCNDKSIVLWLDSPHFPKFFCRCCHIEKQIDNSFITLIGLFNNQLTRANIIQRIRNYERNKSRKKRPRKPRIKARSETGIYEINK